MIVSYLRTVYIINLTQSMAFVLGGHIYIYTYIHIYIYIFIHTHTDQEGTTMDVHGPRIDPAKLHELPYFIISSTDLN